LASGLLGDCPNFRQNPRWRAISTWLGHVNQHSQPKNWAMEW
jgi:hypothetical protein